ncbi:MAG: hypothetical protein KatS3mg078_2035 [Deltaproteobacteria bacterium]|nr:MAG: hypothetical protein KatS3mg078_2035 [Deltaproteobacteria bacterium]
MADYRSLSVKAYSSFDTVTKRYTGLHYYSVFYITESDGDTTVRNGGSIYELSLINNSSVPTPRQVSNITDACDFWYFLRGEKSFIGVSTAGGDRECDTDDDRAFFVTSDMSSSDSPVDMNDRFIILSYPVFHMGPVRGFIVYDEATGNLENCDPDLLSCSVLLSSVTDVFFVARDLDDDIHYICADGTLYRWIEPNLSEVAGITCDIAWLWVNGLYDNEAFYFVDSVRNIKRFDFTNEEVSTIYNGGDVDSFWPLSGLEDLQLTNTNIFFYTDRANGVVKAVPKSGGSVINIGDNIFIWGSWGNNLLYNRYPSFDTVQACIWNDDMGEGCSDANSYWAGLSYARDGTLIDGYIIPVYKFLRVEGATYTSDDVLGLVFGFAGGNLVAVDPSDLLSSGELLGSIDPDTVDISGAGVGNYILLGGFVATLTPVRDIYFVDLSTAGSLQRVTNTLGVDEVPIR